ncbi:MAG TPA: hypothetical protein PKA98_19640, partial [Acidimicrobiales bacterium]|nr:hypothetical protein [Acidimicrobiales bacterium]
MGTIAITGSASGMGAATTARLRADGHTVIGVDLHDADVEADLGSPEGRQAAIDGVLAASGGVLDGFVPFAGLGPLPDRPDPIVVSVNYFGAITLLEGLRPALAAAPDGAAAVAISSNSTTCQPGVPQTVVDACLAGDEDAARAASEADG